MGTALQKQLASTALASWAFGNFFGPAGLLMLAALGGVVYLTAQHVHSQYEILDESEEVDEEQEDDC